MVVCTACGVVVSDILVVIVYVCICGVVGCVIYDVLSDCGVMACVVIDFCVCSVVARLMMVVVVIVI